MPVEVELMNGIMGLLGMICGFCFAAYKFSKEEKAKEWDKKWGNTDFENPYRN